MQVNKNDVFVPSAITFTGKKIIGNNTATIYSGRFKIYESADGSTYSLKYTSTSDEQSKTYNPSRLGPFEFGRFHRNHRIAELRL